MTAYTTVPWRVGLTLMLGSGYRPVPLVVAGIAVLTLAVITAELIVFAVATTTAARRARREQRRSGFVDVVTLPDDPDLADSTGIGPRETA